MKIPTDWTFESVEVATAFDRHVRSQLPWYELATGMVAHIARHYIPRCGTVLDIGCSTGNIGNALKPTLDSRAANFIPIESSKEMADLYNGPNKENLLIDDVTDIEIPEFDVAICFLVLMFIPPERRQELVDRLRASRKKGGAIIIFDKLESPHGYIGTVMWRMALAGKVATGVDPTDIISKELSLMGTQRPLMYDETTDMTQVFQFGNFAGWVID
tara:strand:+ start:10679 stop:11326 length:648 start_codon:yes stop_codon:yes gene_type:complete